MIRMSARTNGASVLHRRPRGRLRQLWGSAPAPPRASALHQSSFRNLRLRFNYRSQMSQLTVTHPSALNAKTFEAWLEHHLLPTLEEGDIVVLDNLNVHKSPRVAEILAKKNCTVRYLPPYQPRLQPNREGLFEAQIPPAKTR